MRIVIDSRFVFARLYVIHILIVTGCNAMRSQLCNQISLLTIRIRFQFCIDALKLYATSFRDERMHISKICMYQQRLCVVHSSIAKQRFETFSAEAIYESLSRTVRLCTKAIVPILILQCSNFKLLCLAFVRFISPRIDLNNLIDVTDSLF